MNFMKTQQNFFVSFYFIFFEQTGKKMKSDQKKNVRYTFIFLLLGFGLWLMLIKYFVMSLLNVKRYCFKITTIPIILTFSLHIFLKGTLFVKLKSHLLLKSFSGLNKAIIYEWSFMGWVSTQFQKTRK